MPNQLSVAIPRSEVRGEQPTDEGLLVHRANPLNAETTLKALNGAEITPVAEFNARDQPRYGANSIQTVQTELC